MAAESLPFAVLGLGRLGRNEFDLATIVDLVFVGKPGLDAEEITLTSAGRIEPSRLCQSLHPRWERICR